MIEIPIYIDLQSKAQHITFDNLLEQLGTTGFKCRLDHPDIVLKRDKTSKISQNNYIVLEQ